MLRRRGLWWLLGVAAALATLTLAAQHLLDPWLRQQLEQQVAAQTHGQYHLRVGTLRTSLWQRAIRLGGLRLRPAAVVADTLPRVRLDVAQLNITGVGLLALLRKGVVPVDSVVLDSARIEVLALAGGIDGGSSSGGGGGGGLYRSEEHTSELQSRP